MCRWAASVEHHPKKRRCTAGCSSKPRIHLDAHDYTTDSGSRSGLDDVSEQVEDVADVEDVGYAGYNGDAGDAHAFLELFQPLDVAAALTAAGNNTDQGKQALPDNLDLIPVARFDLSPWVGGVFSHFLPSVPEADTTPVDTQPNPFLDPGKTEAIHPVLLRHAHVFKLATPQTEFNGFLKFRFTVNKKCKTNGSSVSRQNPFCNRKVSTKPGQHGGTVALRDLDLSNRLFVPLLPTNFGDVDVRGENDRALFNFFLKAIVPGRTVIDGDNMYQSELAKIAAQDSMVKHCLLSLAATYVTDFVQTLALRQRAKFHHKNAVNAVGQALSNLDAYQPGKEVPLLAALYLLSHNEVVNWEIEARESAPKWHRSGKVAEYILRRTDPAYRYVLPRNVQFTGARRHLAVLFCLERAISDCIYPLDMSITKCSFPWLLHGTDAEQRTIVGMAGLSPKLTHFIAKITFLATRLSKNPTGIGSLSVAKEIEKCLETFHQVTIAPRKCYYTVDELLESCHVDTEGKVGTAGEVTDLIAFAHVAAVQICLQCRVFRRPKTHPTVQRVLDQLLECVDRQPTSGILFTAQTPLFAVFIGGIVAYQPRHRDLITKWFLPICDDVRGNVPPVWKALQNLWRWMDDRPVPDEEANGFDVPVAELHPWWEDMVEVLSEWEGRMSLS